MKAEEEYRNAMADEAKFIAFEMGVIAERMQMRVDHAAERFSETVGISALFAAEIVRWCRRAKEMIEPEVSPAPTPVWTSDDRIPDGTESISVDDKEIPF